MSFLTEWVRCDANKQLRRSIEIRHYNIKPSTYCSMNSIRNNTFPLNRNYFIIG